MALWPSDSINGADFYSCTACGIMDRMCVECTFMVPVVFIFKLASGAEIYFSAVRSE